MFFFHKCMLVLRNVKIKTHFSSFSRTFNFKPSSGAYSPLKYTTDAFQVIKIMDQIHNYAPHLCCSSSSQNLEDDKFLDHYYEIWRKITKYNADAHKKNNGSKISPFTVQKLLRKSTDTKSLLREIYPSIKFPDADKSIFDLLSIHFLNELIGKNSRIKLLKFNTLKDAVELLRTSKNIMVLTGAGVSVSCGIPDFRSVNGIYARLCKDFPELPDPQSMFDIHFFRNNPLPFYNFAKEIFPGQFTPSLSHMFIKFLERNGQLLRNYTQNIDTLEKSACIERVIECHGSFARATCLQCEKEVDSSEIIDEVMSQHVAYCKDCQTGVLKPNIVFFGEDLRDEYYEMIEKDALEADLLLVIGSSLQVQPVASIPFNINSSIPQILINRECLINLSDSFIKITKYLLDGINLIYVCILYYQADIKLLGDCDNIVTSLAIAIGGDIKKWMTEEIQHRSSFKNTLDLIKISNENEADNSLPQMLDEEKFRNIINEPAAKRTCFRKPDNGEFEMTENSESEMQCNYVSVESRLPSLNSFFLIKPNISVFKGAEFFYDFDDDLFIPCISEKHIVGSFENGIDSNSSSNNSSNSSSSDELSRCASASQDSVRWRVLGDENLESKNNKCVRSSSCPPFEEYESEKKDI